jgi:hypothetical protein
MSLKPKGEGNTGSRATDTQATETGEPSVENTGRDEEIRRRAHEVYLERDQSAACASRTADSAAVLPDLPRFCRI